MTVPSQRRRCFGSCVCVCENICNTHIHLLPEAARRTKHYTKRHANNSRVITSLSSRCARLGKAAREACVYEYMAARSEYSHFAATAPNNIILISLWKFACGKSALKLVHHTSAYPQPEYKKRPRGNAPENVRSALLVFSEKILENEGLLQLRALARINTVEQCTIHKQSR